MGNISVSRDDAEVSVLQTEGMASVKIRPESVGRKGLKKSLWSGEATEVRRGKWRVATLDWGGLSCQIREIHGYQVNRTRPLLVIDSFTEHISPARCFSHPR